MTGSPVLARMDLLFSTEGAARTKGESMRVSRAWIRPGALRANPLGRVDGCPGQRRATEAERDRDLVSVSATRRWSIGLLDSTGGESTRQPRAKMTFVPLTSLRPGLRNGRTFGAENKFPLAQPVACADAHSRASRMANIAPNTIEAEVMALR